MRKIWTLITCALMIIAAAVVLSYIFQVRSMIVPPDNNMTKDFGYENVPLQIRMRYPFDWAKVENNTSVTFYPPKESNSDVLSSVRLSIFVENVNRDETLSGYLERNSLYDSLLANRDIHDNIELNLQKIRTIL